MCRLCPDCQPPSRALKKLKLMVKCINETGRLGYSYSTAMPGEDGYLCSVWDSVGLASGQLCAKHLRCSGHQLKWRRGRERKVGEEGGGGGRGGRRER